jgi:hypothetical protein
VSAPAAQLPRRSTAVAWSAGGITRQRQAADRRTEPGATLVVNVAPAEPARPAPELDDFLPDDEQRLQRRDAVVHRLALERTARAKRA